MKTNKPERRGNQYTKRIWATDGATGHRKQVRVTAPTIEKWKRRATEIRHASYQGTLVGDARTSVADLLDRYLAHARTRTRARTWTRYEELMRGHVLPRIGTISLASLRPVHVQRVIDEMLSSGLAPATVRQAYRVLFAALRQGVRWQLLAVNPAAAIQPPRPERPRLTVPDAATVGRILEAAKGTPFHAPLVLAAATGARRGEVLGLRWQEVELSTGLVRITATLQRIAGQPVLVDPKTDRSRRTVILPPFAVAVLRAHRKAQAERRLLWGDRWTEAGFVFDRGDGRPFDPAHLSHAFSRITASVGCPGVRLHDLRHAFATALLAAGVHPKVASEALGHSSVAFTMDVYSHVLPTMQGQAAEAIQRALGAMTS